MSFHKPCHMPFSKLIPPFTLTAPNVNSFYILILSSVAINLYRCWATRVKTLYIAAVIILEKVTDSLLHSRFLCRHATFLPWGGALRDDTKCSRKVTGVNVPLFIAWTENKRFLCTSMCCGDFGWLMYLKYLNFAWKIEEVFKYVDHLGLFSNVFTL